MKHRARLAVFVGGCIGTLARAAVGVTAAGTFPWRTFAVNLLGTAVLGLLAGRLKAGRLSVSGVRFAGVGVMGSLTTFGTMTVQILGLVADREPGIAAAYAGASLVAGAGVGIVALRIGEEWA